MNYNKDELLESWLYYQEQGWNTMPLIRHKDKSKNKWLSKQPSPDHKWTLEEMHQYIFSKGVNAILAKHDGLVAIDLDDKQYADTWLEQILSKYPDCLSVTQSGSGYHIVYAANSDIVNTHFGPPSGNGLHVGADILIAPIVNGYHKGKGVYIPRSYHPDMDNGTINILQRETAPFIMMPESLKQIKEIIEASYPTITPQQPHQIFAGRNDRLFKKTLKAACNKDPEAIIQAIDEAQATGLSTEEIDKTVNSSLGYAKDNELWNGRYLWKLNGATEEYLEDLFTNKLNVQFRLNVRTRNKEIKYLDEPWTPYERDVVHRIRVLITRKCYHVKSFHNTTAFDNATLPSMEQIETAMAHFWSKFTYDPFLEYLENLPAWDGKCRYEELFAECFDLIKGDYLTELARMMMVSIATTQTRELYVDFKLTPVLISTEQTEGKSMFIRKLLPAEENGDPSLGHCDNVDLMGNKKEIYEALHGKILCEAPEIAGLGKKDLDKIKAVLHTRNANIRWSYDRSTSHVDLRAQVIATANDEGHGVLVPDGTGHSRWAPIIIDKVDPGRIRAWLDNNIDQLWAQAYKDSKVFPEHKEVYFYFSKELDKERERIARSVELNINKDLDLMLEDILKNEIDKDHFKLDELYVDVDGHRRNFGVKMNILTARLRALGCERVRTFAMGNCWTNAFRS